MGSKSVYGAGRCILDEFGMYSYDAEIYLLPFHCGCYCRGLSVAVNLPTE